MFSHGNYLFSILIIVSLVRKRWIFILYFTVLPLCVAHIIYWWYMEGLPSPHLHQRFFHSCANSMKGHFWENNGTHFTSVSFYMNQQWDYLNSFFQGG